MRAAVHGVAKVGHDLATEQTQRLFLSAYAVPVAIVKCVTCIG